MQVVSMFVASLLQLQNYWQPMQRMRFALQEKRGSAGQELRHHWLFKHEVCILALVQYKYAAALKQQQCAQPL